MDTTTKRCRVCEQDLPLDLFYRHSRSRDGLKRLCKACSNAEAHAWALANPEKRRATEKRRVRSADKIRPQRRRYRATPNGKRATLRYWLKRNYGITLETFEEMERAQSGKCAICNRIPSGEGHTNNRLHVDHDHTSGVVRGLLCRDCNLGLGHFGENIDRLLGAVAYLKAGRWIPA